eukprot:TRINITY_DN15814_c0_g1_i3.p1 TRINITY_DN15814_c0_g1~~TRINITY_DN15814_c0_g1_i3.p1  ORF type:complete len:389 (-),score=65.27 TRINITY_DN15814_c0_g1_i3:69-1235(-)
MAMTLIHSIPAIRATLVAGLLMLATILISYLLFLEEGRTPAFLPTISTTWDYVPANYLSRWSVSFSCFVLQLMAVVSYCATRDRFKHSQLLLGMAVVGLLCLSVVGAACSSTKLPSCRGAGKVHDVAAVTFFVLYDLYLIISIKQLGASPVPALALAGAACAAKIRWLPSGYLGTSFPVVPVFEWADVGVIVIAQLVLALHIAQPYCVSIADVAEPGKPRGSETTSITASFPANKITVATVSLMFGCSVITYPFALHQGIIEPGFPYVISDTWWHAPGDIIARWGVTFSTHLLQILLLMLDHATRRRAHNWLWLAQLGTFGMSVVAVVSEVEQPILHVVCALTWGVGVDIYMLCLLYTSDAADEEDSVDLGGRRIIKKKKKKTKRVSR